MRELNVDPKLVADQQGHAVDVNLDIFTETSVALKKQAVDCLESSFANLSVQAAMICADHRTRAR
jgi:hypothetical protein